MTINITNPETDRLVRTLADIEGVGVTEAVTLAIREALQRRRSMESTMASAARLRARFGIDLTPGMQEPLPRHAYDELSGEEPGDA